MGGKASPEAVRRAMRKYHANNREKMRIKSREYYLANKGQESERYRQRRQLPEQKASNLLRTAVFDGRIVKPNKCEGCEIEEGALSGHHKDYTKPYEVSWLCSICHGRVHRKE